MGILGGNTDMTKPNQPKKKGTNFPMLVNVPPAKPKDEVCSGGFHAYPKTYAGSPEYAAKYFSRCLCGKKRKVTTVKEVDA
jgi:hypothetical protein